MEQLTFKEWCREQVKKAPSFAISFGLMALLLIISAFIEYAKPVKPTEFGEMTADISEIEDSSIEDIKDNVTSDSKVDRPSVQAPSITDEPSVEPVEQVVENPAVDVIVDVPPTDTMPTEPFPTETIKSITVISDSGGSSGSLQGVYGKTRSKAGKAMSAKRYGIPKTVDAAILSALRWFKSAQEEDGSWQTQKWQGGHMSNEGGTAMALLCFLGYGCTDREPSEFANTVKKAAEYIVSKQQPTGSWGGRMYEHGLITLAMCEAAAMMPRNMKVKEAATKGIEFIAKNAGPDGGFSYGGPGNDNSVTIFQLQALKAAITANISVPPEFKKKAENWLTMCVAGDGSTSYRPAAGQQGGGSVSMTAAALSARLLLGESRSGANAKAQAEWLAKANYVTNGQPAANNSYIVYYLSLSMFQMGDKYWADWRDVYLKTLMDKQERQGPTAGSWPTKVCPWGGTDGRIYTTAFSCLALEAAYRYERKK